MSNVVRRGAAAGLLIVTATAVLAGAVPAASSARQATPSVLAGAVPAASSARQATPAVRVETLVTGLVIPWDLTFLPDRTMLFTERGGKISTRTPQGTVGQVTAGLADLYVGSESGLMGIVTDPAFGTNRRFFYTCQAYRGTGTAPIDIRVIRWQLSTDLRTATRVGTPVVEGIPITSGRHGGCRLRFAQDGTLRIGTGDAVIGTSPQNLGSLGGKTLRVGADGLIPTDNPFFARGGNARYVWTYGHRNVQGLMVRPGSSELWAVEQGPSRDDEVNRLVKGGNYGWDPGPSYDESRPMTDTVKFPSAIRAVWTSGSTTIATSGGAFLVGSAWGRWQGAIVAGQLKGAGVLVIMLRPDGGLARQEELPEVNNTYGRIRTVQPGPDGSLYLTTSNGSDDKILRVVPTGTPQAFTPGLDVSPTGVAAAVRGTTVTAFGRGTDHRVYYRNQHRAGATWTPYARIPGTLELASAPAAVSWGGDRLDVFAVGNNRRLLHTVYAGGRWSPWQDHGGALTTAPAVVSPASGQLDVFARGTDDALYRKRWTGTSWTGWTRLGGILSAAPAAATGPGGRITVYVRGASGHLYDLELSGATVSRSWRRLDQSTWTAPAASGSPALVRITVGPDGAPVLWRGSLPIGLDGQLSSAPAVVQRPDGKALVFGRGVDGELTAYDGSRFTSLGGSLS